MNQEAVTSLQSKVNSGEANFSTSESTHSKTLNNHASLPLQHQFKNMPQLLNLSQLQEPDSANYKFQDQSQGSNRLFTFMDERDAQRKIIKNYIFRNTCKRQSNDCGKIINTKAQNNGNIIELIEQSRKKREDFLKKIVNQPPLNTTHSNVRLKRLSKSKTPKHLAYVQVSFETLQPKSKPKTPRLSNKRLNTPTNNHETTLFRAKSNLEKQHLLCRKKNNPYKLFKQKKQVCPGQSFLKEEKASIQNNKIEEQKQLLKKKKQLQRQLLAINESLLFCKKMSNLTNKTKKPKKGVQSQRKKSKIG